MPISETQVLAYLTLQVPMNDLLSGWLEYCEQGNIQVPRTIVRAFLNVSEENLKLIQ
jgi:hypothetical protein